MDRYQRNIGTELAQLRQTNAAWQLLASRIAPYIIACLKRLFEPGRRTTMEDMEQALAALLEDNANTSDIEDNVLQQARRELRDWIKRGLVVERGGELFATDDLQRTIQFIDSLQDRIMTSTASRLAIVQREIADLALHLSPDVAAREERLVAMIAGLQEELDRVRAGDFEVRKGGAAIEGMRDVYDLAVSLRSDFRRVEDSYRGAEKDLRQSLISDQQHRGQAIDRLLNSHDALVETPEGQVFASFHQQLSERSDIERMRNNLREITRNELAADALNRRQRDDLSTLVLQLITESSNVIRARARSDRDVKGFIKSGLAAEHFTVGRLLNELFVTAQDLDWSQQALRRQTTPLPLLAMPLPNVPTPDRLRASALATDDNTTLDLTPVTADLEAIDNDFWLSFDGLDRQDFLDQVLDCLARRGAAMSVGELAEQLVNRHDLEAISLLLALARETHDGAPNDKFPTEEETINLTTSDGECVQYTMPKFQLDHTSLGQVSLERI